DRAGVFTTYWRVAVPLLRGGPAFLGSFTFIGAWNEYVWPLNVLVSPERQTPQTALQDLNCMYLTEHGMAMARAVHGAPLQSGVSIIGARHCIASIADGAIQG